MGSNFPKMVGAERRRMKSYGALAGTELVDVTSSDGETTGTTTVATIRGTASTADLTKLAAITASAAELNVLDDAAVTATIVLAAGAADTMTATITMKDAANATVAAVHAIEVWISEATTGIGLTADSYSGAVTATTGSIHTALTAKKHFLGVTAATGIFVLSVVDSAKPADQYVVVKRPLGGRVVVSAASGTSWG